MTTTLHDLNPDAAFGVDTESSVLANKPDVAMLVARIVSAWSTVEGFVGLAATALLAGRANVAMAMYEAMAAEAAQYAALYAAARASLPEQDAKLFCAALRAVRACGQGRHQLAHGIFVQSSEAESELLVVEQRYFAEMMKLFFTPPGPGEQREDQIRRESRAFSKKVVLLDVDDLKAILKEADEASRIAIDLAVLASPTHHRGEEARGALRANPRVKKQLGPR